MSNWNRNTLWRQGCLLKDETINALNLLSPEHLDDTVVIVATHDCDLAQSPEKEPEIEVIVGHRIQQIDGNYTHAKSSRTLDLVFEGYSTFFAEFNITNKRIIQKVILSAFEPNIDFKLSLPQKSTFQVWLASRYRRSAFPDEFEHRLKNSGLAKKIAKIVKQYGEMITAIFFDVDEGNSVEFSTSNFVYSLSIILVYETELDPNEAERVANEAKIAIELAFRTKLFDEESRNWEQIELQYIDVVSDEALSYRQSRLLKKWRLDHISLATTPQQPISND